MTDGQSVHLGAEPPNKMTQRKAFAWWERNISNHEVTPHAILPIAKALMKTDGPKAPPIHGL
jgi:hypothetical protein